MQWIKNQSITAKMVFLVGTMLVLTIILSSFSLFKMNRVAEEVKGIAHEHIPLIQLVSDATVKQLQSALIVEKALRAADFTADLDAEELKQLQQNFSLVSQKFDQEVHQAQSNLEGMLQYHKNEKLEKEQRLLQHLNAVIEHHQSYEHSAAEILQAIADRKNGQVLSEKAQQLEVQQTAQNRQLGALLTEVEKLTESSLMQTELEEQQAIWGMILLVAIALLVGLLIGFFISRQLVHSLSYACTIAEQMAQGNFDLDIQVDRRDEVGRLLNAMQTMSDSLGKIVSSVMSSSYSIATAVVELSTVASSNRQSVDAQQQNTEQVASAMTEMAATITEVAANAEEASSSSQRAETYVKDGCRMIEKNRHLAEELVRSAENSQALITNLQSGTTKIQNFVSVVNAIAEQTNLLALNASIEAARAGEQGRGFAVVADEVRVLASRSQKATQEIDSLIESLVDNTDSAVSAIQVSSEQIGQSSILIQDIKQQMNLIDQALVELNESNVQIATASEQQSVAAEQISRSMVHIRDSGQSVLMSTDETKRAGEDLSIQASDLRHLMSQFQVKSSG
ncbi:Methyl-accepting chemotaxis protein McpS [Vibrio ruber DSM 16370]|uniref:Methyl-accepting chemotaxis protein McpS n=1 Tax=Vibrio ruber (strain DSM 16370 / JCM 11486 / BCRC 17186 / CECT 7878 / LMG 23124 / VR1) TaxID=1123498 RepID=A0A1R4L9E4_VIBR1|nr:methyl-accepting chemotaxis protein [Vibrio ruber]SJN52993.1 Methyl-accepting chemotaxis protein McpS [Vibrio ruber DSM 16370]